MQLPTEAAVLTEKTSVAMAQQVQWADIKLPFATVPSSYVCVGEGEPMVLIHGFDSSLLEFRRLVPELAQRFKVYALDLLGFGFCDRTATDRADPDAIKQHLNAFLEQVVGADDVILVGASMGGGAAIDFATSYPEKVTKLVLIDAVGFAGGPAIGKLMFPPLDKWATDFLKSPGVRRRISQRAYYNKALVTPDAEMCASLHLLAPRWSSWLIAFTKSGGYNFLAKRIKNVSVPALVIWGRQDKILGTKDAERFEQTIANCTLVWVEDSGHVPHLEQPKITAKHIVDFLF
ncbi:MAG: alpha/beta fold hydrolase [Cyanobacteria bacterium P01_D01_bin.105]